MLFDVLRCACTLSWKIYLKMMGHILWVNNEVNSTLINSSGGLLISLVSFAHELLLGIDV